MSLSFLMGTGIIAIVLVLPHASLGGALQKTGGNTLLWGEEKL